MYETFITIAAMVWSGPLWPSTTVAASNMALFMFTERTSMGKGFQTNRTFVSLFPGVCLQVITQCAFVCKHLHADAALVKLNTRVNLLVIPQGCLVCKEFVTH